MPLRLLSAIARALRATLPAQGVDAGAQADAHVKRAKTGLRANRGFAAACEQLDAALALVPTHLEALRWRAHCRTALRDYPGAVADLDAALVQDVTDAWLHYARGMAHSHLADYPEAIACYTRALARDPSFHKAVEWRGHVRNVVGDFAGALRDFDRSLGQTPTNPWVRIARGRARFGVTARRCSGRRGAQGGRRRRGAAVRGALLRGREPPAGG